MRTNGFREDGALSLNAHQLGAATVYLGLAVRSRARAGSPRLRLPSPGAVSPVPTLTPHRSALPRALAQLGFYFLQAPAMEDGAVRLALEVAYACVCGVVTAAFYKAASTDPADDTRLQVRDERTHEREAIDARSPTASSSLPTSRALITAPLPPTSTPPARRRPPGLARSSSATSARTTSRAGASTAARATSASCTSTTTASGSTTASGARTTTPSSSSSRPSCSRSSRRWPRARTCCAGRSSTRRTPRRRSPTSTGSRCARR